MENIENFISSILKYPSSTSKKKKRWITFKCLVCGDISSKVYAKNRWKSVCESCLKGRFSTADFIQKAKLIFGNHYDYSETNYINHKAQVDIICPVHGKYSQRAAEHLNGHGCNQCKFDAKSILQRLSPEVWMERLKSYPLITPVDTNQFSGWHNKVDLLCKIHGVFSVQLGAIGEAKYLCKECAYISHQEQSIRTEFCGTIATIYYVYLPQIDMYKLGVTTDLESRLKSLGECVLIAKGEKEYTEALRLEHLAHTTLTEFQYKGRAKLIKNGSTELYKCDILPQLKRALQQ